MPKTTDSKPLYLYHMPSVLWAVFILILCLMPGKDLPDVSLWQADKLGHFSFYILLSLLMYWAWRKPEMPDLLRGNAVIKIILITFCYGFVVELLQGWLTTDRHFDLLDAAANAAGGATGGLLSVKLFK